MLFFMFWFSCFLIIYIFIGYPFLLFVLAKFKQNQNTVASQYTPGVDIILVTRNAELIILDKIKNIFSLDYPADKLRLIIVSDASTDQTVEKITSYNDPRISVIPNKQKTSKSACLNLAVKQCTAEVLFLTDVRQTIDNQALKNLVQHFIDPEIGAVSGELMFSSQGGNDFSAGIDGYWRYEKIIRKLESKIGSVPGVTGAIYALRKECFRPIPDETLLDDVLIPMNIVLQHKRVIFEAKALAYDVPSNNPGKEKIRKTRTIAGNWQLLFLQPKLINPFSNPIWLQFFSHKVLRLISPILLAIILVLNIILLDEHLLYALTLAVQLIFYTLGLSGSLFPSLLRLPMVKTISAFLSLMVFTLYGLISFSRKKHLTLWT